MSYILRINESQFDSLVDGKSINIKGYQSNKYAKKIAYKLRDGNRNVDIYVQTFKTRRTMSIVVDNIFIDEKNQYEFNVRRKEICLEYNDRFFSFVDWIVWFFYLAIFIISIIFLM